MGLDLFLGLMVLIGAIRGWLKGFVLQAVQLGGLVACVYEAGPLRDFAKPHLEGYLRGIRPDLFDRLLWWVACVVSYVVTVGLATWLVRLYRRRPYGEPDLYRGDQAAGLLMGAAKALLIVTLLVAGLEKYALSYLKGLKWAEQQAGTSHAVVWNEKYQPLARIWAWPPLQTFVTHVQKMGLGSPSSNAPAEPAVRTAAAPSQPLALRPRPSPFREPAEAPDPAGVLDSLTQEIRSLGPPN
jgi:uncharacterized membrane protein required for colicin V production